MLIELNMMVEAWMKKATSPFQRMIRGLLYVLFYIFTILLWMASELLWFGIVLGVVWCIYFLVAHGIIGISVMILAIGSYYYLSYPKTKKDNV